MTGRDIADLLFHSIKGVTPSRIEKAKQSARRNGVTWTEVLESLTLAEREQVEHAE